MSGKNFMSYGDADTILTEFSNDIKSRVSTKANQGLTSQQIANAKANIDIEKVPNVATNDQTPTFLEESSRVNINSGDKLSLIFGKIKKFFSDLKTVAFTGSYNDLSNKPTIPAAVAVKGNAESTYRTGNVNLTPANIGACTSNEALKMKGWWSSSSSNNADNLNNGSVFAYAASHNTPTTGPLFAFASEDGNKYVAQMQFQYNGDAVYHRVKNGDSNTWRSWQAFKSQADVDSAYSSGYQQRIETVTLSNGQTGKSATNVGLPRSMTQYSYIFVYGRMYLGTTGYYGVMGGFDPNNLTKISLSTSSSGTLTNCIAFLRLMGTNAYMRVVRYISDTQIYISNAYDSTQNYKITTNSEQYLVPMTLVMVRK